MTEEGITYCFARRGKTVAIPWNGRAREVERIALGIHHHFHSVRVKRLFGTVDRHRQCGHPNLTLSKVFCDLTDNNRRNHWLIALNVNDDRVVTELAFFNHLGQTLGTRLMIGTGHAHFTARCFDRARNVFMVGCDDNAVCT
jgi:hypothetical protein